MRLIVCWTSSLIKLHLSSTRSLDLSGRFHHPNTSTHPHPHLLHHHHHHHHHHHQLLLLIQGSSLLVCLESRVMRVRILLIPAHHQRRHCLRCGHLLRCLPSESMRLAVEWWGTFQRLLHLRSISRKATMTTEWLRWRLRLRAQQHLHLHLLQLMLMADHGGRGLETS